MELNSGHKIPVLGLGTATFTPVKADDKKAVLQALHCGYRHFDTAAHYGSEADLGEAIAEAVETGLIKSRQEVFITTKLWCTDTHVDAVLPALKKSLENLKMEYVDLYLIHYPVSVKDGNLVPFDSKGVWGAMEECHGLGLAKSIGVSNFTCKKLGDLLAFAKIVPAVNQVELNPSWQQKNMIDLCKSKGIVVTSFSPLGAVGTSWGSNIVVDNEILKDIANIKGKTVPQVCLRWAYQQGVTIVVKSYRPERMQENRDIFDWELTDEECQRIREIPQRKGNRAEEFVSENGLFKSLEEFWDGEI